MKRDMELIRKLVLAIEDAPAGWAPSDLQIEGFTGEQIAYHSYLLVDAGLAVGAETTSFESAGPEYMLSYLTWAGHEFADACRNDTIWRKSIALIKEKAGSVTFEVLKQVLVTTAKGALGMMGL